MKTNWKIMAFVVCIMMGTLLFGSRSLAGDNRKIVKQNTNFQVETEIGLNHLAVYGKAVPVKVTIDAKDAFQGEVRVVPVSQDAIIKVALAQEISMQAGETQEISFVLEAYGYSGMYYVELIDDVGNTVYCEQDKFNFSDGNNVIVGVLSDDYESLTYFDDLKLLISTYELSSELLELDETCMPDNAGAMSVLNYIVADRYDMGRLSEKQTAALQEWIKKGGVLIAGGETRWESDSEWMKDMRSDADFVSEDKTLSYWDVGDGRIVRLTYELTTNPISSDKENTVIATKLLNDNKTIGTEDFVNGNYYDSSAYDGYRIAKMTDDNRKPSSLLYGGLLFVYVVFSGPLLYLLLKKIHQQEKIWIAVPGTALVFTGIIYLSSMQYRIEVPIIDTLSMISLSEDSGEERIYTSVTCPKAETYSVQLSPEYSNLENYTEPYIYDSTGTKVTKKGDYDYLIKDTKDGKKLVFHNKESFRRNTFTITGTTDNQIGTITYDLDCTTRGFGGRITNHTVYDLKGVVITFENHIYMAGDMKPGESVEIDTSKLITAKGYGTFEDLYKENKQGTYCHNQIDVMMENSYMKINRYGTGLIWAKIDNYIQGFAQEETAKISGMGVIYMSYEAEYQDVKGVYYPSIEEMVSDVNGDYDRQDFMMYSSVLEAEYSFENYPGITTLKKIAEKGNDGMYARVYAYNPKTKEYQEIFRESNVVTGKELRTYIEDDRIKLRYEADEQQGYLPRICAGGDELNADD